MVNKSDHVLFLVIAAFVPFSYFYLADIRVIALLPIILFGYVAARAISSTRGVILFKPNVSFYLFLMLLLYALVVTMVSGSVDSLAAISVFFIFAYWPFFFDRKYFSFGTLSMMVRAYALFATFVAGGLLVQLALFFAFGIEVGRVVIFRERAAFGFIWLDFSFLSLYLASAIPLLFVSFRAALAFVFSVVLLAGTVATSARTGVVSLVFVVTAFYFARLLASMFVGKIRKTHVRVLLIVVPIAVSSAAMMLSLIPVRSFSFGDSGRLSGYLNAYHFWLENPMFGAWLDSDMYLAQVDLIPHNVLIYVIAMGGLTFFSLFIVWLALLLGAIFKAPDAVKISALVCLFGFTFIPSFFSAYFFAFLLSLVFLSQSVRRERNATGLPPVVV